MIELLIGLLISGSLAAILSITGGALFLFSFGPILLFFMIVALLGGNSGSRPTTPPD